ncbi:hypothetical protein ACLB2K_040455 [Fragaria x ananassa]
MEVPETASARTVYTRQVDTLEAQIAELAQARHHLAWAEGGEARVQAVEETQEDVGPSHQADHFPRPSVLSPNGNMARHTAGDNVAEDKIADRVRRGDFERLGFNPLGKEIGGHDNEFMLL